MTLEQMLAVLEAVRSVGCRFWLGGGRGVDALWGTRVLAAELAGTDERDRSVNAGDLDRAVELDHRQPPPGCGDRVVLTRDAESSGQTRQRVDCLTRGTPAARIGSAGPGTDEYLAVVRSNPV
jgi:hypothetical protein